ncbi:hypothetical protein BGX24_009305 [Mortierella sp. AD032]|nr:hypothetical protein BGX24_009305 [Mortierella sp. AD032]
MTISSPRKGYSPASALKRALGALEDAEDFRGSKECLAPCAEIDTYFSAMDPFAREGLLASTKDMKLRKKIADVYAKQCKILLQQKEHILAQRSAENYALWRGDSGKSTLSKFVATITESIVKSMHGEPHEDTNRSLNIFTVFSGTTSSAESSPDTNSPDTNSPDTNSPDIKSSDTKSPVTKSPDTKSPDTLEEITITERSISITERSIAIEHTINPVSKTPEASLASNNPRSRPIRTGSKASLLRAGSDVKLKYKPPSSPMTMSNGDPSTSTSSRPIVDVPVPELCSRFDNTTQLAFCANLLKSRPPSSFSSGGIVADIGPEWQSWKASAEEAEGEKDRILELVQDVVVKFINDTIKGSEVLAEVLLLGPVLDRPLYRRLLTCLINEFEGAKLLNATQLRALIKLVQSASIDYLDPDDLVRILAILRTRLQATHTQSIHPIVLAWAVSRVLDVMVEGSKVMDLNRIRDHKPLSDLLAEFSSNSNPYLKHQVLYASQALLYIPDDETRWQYTKRHVGRITMGLLGIASVCKLDLGKFEEGVDHLWEALGDAHEVAVKMVGGVESMVESGQGVLKSIRDTFRLRAKRLWYAALQEAEECVRDGRLADFNRLVFETFCRRDVEFRWGVCLLLDGIVFDPRWGTATRQQAIDLLGVLYRNETDWKRDDGINRGILNILRHAANLDVAEIEIHALNLVQSLETDGDAAKRAFYKVCMSDHLRPLLSEDPFANEPSSKLLSQAQGVPKVEDQLLKLQKQRLKGYDDALYIPPQARANLKSSDGSKAPLFPLMDKIMAFLSSDQLVFLLQGDSGAGKSTFSRQLECSLWKNYKKGGPIPLHINLPVIDKPEENMIAKQLKIYDFTPDQIRELKTKRHFILICDGYDEGQININLHTRNRLNQEGEWRAKLVISCRTQYLGADYRGRFQPGEGHYSRSNIDLFQQAILAAFSKAQIQMYVLQYVYKEKPLWTAENFMDKLSRIPHLMDLVSNPFLLTLTLKALPNLVGSQDDLESIAVTRVELYDNFVDSWLGSGKKRLEYCLAREARASFQGLLDEGFESGGIAFAKELATDIYKEQGGLPVIQYLESTDGQSWKAKFFGPGSRKEHLRDSLPLLRNGKQRRFLHHSLLDYFYSRVFFDPRQYDDDDDQDPDEEEQTINNRGLGISNHKLNHLDIIRHHAVLDFLAERVNKHPNFANLLHAMVETSKKDKSVFTAAANAITILVKAGVRFNGQNLQGIAIPGADLSGGEFDWTDFQGADLSKVNFTRTWLRQADLRKATLTKVQFGELPFLMEDDQVWSCAYSPDGKTLATGCRNGVISIYSTATWKKLHILQKSTAPVHGLAFSPNNQQLASACDDNMVHLWSVKFGNLQSTLQGHTNGVKCVAYSPDGRHIASGSMDKTTIIWDSLGMKSCTLEGHVDGVRGLSYSPNGENIATASADNTVRLWNVKSRSSVIIGRHSKQVMAISFSPTGLQIASGCSDGVIGFWNVGSRGRLEALLTHQTGVNSPAEVRTLPLVSGILVLETLFTASMVTAKAFIVYDTRPQEKTSPQQV